MLEDDDFIIEWPKDLAKLDLNPVIKYCPFCESEILGLYDPGPGTFLLSTSPPLRNFSYEAALRKENTFDPS